VPEDFGEIAATSAEDVKIARVRIALQLLLHLKRQALHSATHVRVARRIQTRHPAGIGSRPQRLQGRAITAEGASAPIRTRTPFNSTSITRSRSRSTAATSPTVAAAFDDHRRKSLAPRSASAASLGAIYRRGSCDILATRHLRDHRAGSAIAARIRTRSSSLHRRRRSSPVINVIRPMLCS